VLVVNEASMLDLTLARRLFDAVPPNCRVLLLGDKNQLAAVEAGAVFAELARSALRGTAVTFSHSHRFAPGRGIAQLAAALNAGDGDAVKALLAAPPDASIAGPDAPVPTLHSPAFACCARCAKGRWACRRSTASSPAPFRAARRTGPASR
jgi:exodeoxyribonuclease V alpha subunit